MARPRIFISSTFYDLRQVREDIERTVRELGYEPVRHETGSIPYGKDERPESAAYREVDLCDVLVAIVGGRYGSESRETPGFSISQNEIRRALERGVQVFIFVERSVLSEYSTYQLNKEAIEVKYRFVDDIRIFRFIDELYKLPSNNAIAPFETSAEVSQYIREQFAGLFHRFLQDQKRGVELRVLEEMNTAARTLREVVTYLTEDRKNTDEAIKSILLANHPAFQRFADLTNTTYRVFFSSRGEMEAWLRAHQWTPMDAFDFDPDSFEEWVHPMMGYLKITRDLFDSDGRLLPFSPVEWQDDWVQRVDLPPASTRSGVAEEDIPF